MSTRCQIGFYASAEQPLNAPSALIYRHMDGYPEGPSGVLATLLPWAVAFDQARGLEDAEYAAVRGLVALIRGADALDQVIGYGICGDHALHGDIDYFYRVDPEAITVYSTRPYPPTTDADPDSYAGLTEHSRHAIVWFKEPNWNL